MGFRDHLIEFGEQNRRKSHSIELGENLSPLEKPNDHAFAVQSRHGGDAQVDIFAGETGLDAAVLWQAALGDVELGENLEPGNDRALQLARR